MPWFWRSQSRFFSLLRAILEKRGSPILSELHSTALTVTRFPRLLHGGLRSHFVGFVLSVVLETKKALVLEILWSEVFWAYGRKAL